MAKQETILKRLHQNLVKINSTSTGRRVFLQSMPLLLVACSTTTKTKHRYREGDNRGQFTSMKVADEREVALKYARQFEKEYPPIKDKLSQSYIQDLGGRLVKENKLQGRPYFYEFKLVKAKMPNAFALPAGKIYVTTPLVKMSRSEAELAGVVGHEIGHVKARHVAERMEVAKKNETKNMLLGLGGAILGGFAGYGLSKLVCSKEDRECIKRITLYGGMAGASGGLLISKFTFMANSREDEMEADRIGYRVALKADYDKNYIGAFYQRLKKLEDQHKGKKNKALASLADVLSTHPPGKERVDQMKQLIRSSKQKKGIISSKMYKKIKSRV